MPPVLEEKSPLDVERWLRHVDLFTRDFGNNRADVLVTLVDEKLRDILRSHELTGDKIDDGARYEHLKEVLRKTCSRPVSSIKARDLFLTRRQNLKESAGSLANDLRCLAAQAFPSCDSKARDEFVLKQFVSGLRSDVVLVKLMADGPYSLAKAVEIAEFCDKIPVREQEQQAPKENPKEKTEPVKPSTSASSSQPETAPNVNLLRSKGRECKKVFINGLPVRYILDTGADFSVISEEGLKRLKMKFEPASSFAARGADSSLLSIVGCWHLLKEFVS